MCHIPSARLGGNLGSFFVVASCGACWLEPSAFLCARSLTVSSTTTAQQANDRFRLGTAVRLLGRTPERQFEAENYFPATQAVSAVVGDISIHKNLGSCRAGSAGEEDGGRMIPRHVDSSAVA